MGLIELVSIVALLQYLMFGVQVGKARTKYGIKGPATTGNEMFERVYRVQMNTLELLVVFLPALWMAARHFSPLWVGAVGAVFIVGRVIYFRAYTREPSKRGLGYMLSIMPTVALLVAAVVGIVIEWLRWTNV